NIENDDRALPRQQIGNHNAGAFTRAGWRFDEDMLAATKGEEASAFAANNNTRTRAEAVTHQFAFACKARSPVERRGAYEDDIDHPQKQGNNTGKKSSGHRPDNLGIAAIVIDELQYF